MLGADQESVKRGRLRPVLGAIFSVFSSFSFSVNSILVRRGVARASPAQGIYITVSMGVPILLFAALVSGQLLRLSELRWTQVGVVALSGIIHFAVGRYCNYRSVQSIGATRSGPTLGLATPYSLLVAIFVLNEDVTWLMGLGIVLLMAGPAIIVERRSQRQTAAGESGQGFTLRQAEGYLFGLLAGLSYGTSPLLIRWALKDTGMGIAGSFIAYAGATAVLWALLVLPSQYAMVRSIPRNSIKPFMGASMGSVSAQFFRFMALSIAPVTIVNPLQRLSTVFTLLLSFAFNRNLEVFNLRMVFGVLLSVAGSLLLTLRL